MQGASLARGTGPIETFEIGRCPVCKDRCDRNIVFSRDQRTSVAEVLLIGCWIMIP